MMARGDSGGWRRCLRAAVGLALGLVAMGRGVEAGVGGRIAPSDTLEACAVDDELLDPIYSLHRAAAGLTARKAMTVVVVGSASSLGKGTSSPAHSYPALLQADLAAALHGNVAVVNRVMAGTTAPAAIARLDTDILSFHPDLVVWEVGTTDAVKEVDLNDFTNALTSGLQTLDQRGVDVILVDSQYSPQTAAMVNFTPYLETIHRVAEAADVLVFPRWDIMHRYTEDGRFNPTAGTAAEQTRNDDFLHGCLARLLSHEIAMGLKPKTD
jgi:hypothetical protein